MACVVFFGLAANAMPQEIREALTRFQADLNITKVCDDARQAVRDIGELIGSLKGEIVGLKSDFNSAHPK